MPGWLWPTERCKLLRMKRFVLLALAVPTALLAGKSDPGAPLVAADETYSKASQRNGAWTAVRQVALPESETFVPHRVKVLEFGKDLPDPPFTQSWKPEHAWISCDGTAGVTFGSWKIDGHPIKGWYESVWVRMKDGSYRVLLRRGGRETRKLHSRPGRKGIRAVCGGKAPPLPLVAPDVGTDFKLGASHDQTLIWSSAVSQGGAVRVVISLWDGKVHVPILEDVAPAPQPR